MRFVLHALAVYFVVVTPIVRTWAKIGEKGSDGDFAPAFCLCLGLGLGIAALLFLAVLLLVVFIAFKVERESSPPR